ncbi:MAG: dihydroxyacetone kinase phosphoryl donor subunit DhaM [Caldilineaceae bacterium]|nr:dihydroxyacetone kinase phosphoryl donor subunit DhaM [Caldilineaceae bacterium]
MIGLVIVSHSAKLAAGVQELAAQMAGDQVGISQAGGLSDDGEQLGTDAFKILSAIEDVWCEDGVLLLMDLGSAIMSAELALEMLPAQQRQNCLLSNAPLVEGAIVAALHASLGEPLQAVNAVAEAALSTPKLANTG